MYINSQRSYDERRPFCCHLRCLCRNERTPLMSDPPLHLLDLCLCTRSVYQRLSPIHEVSFIFSLYPISYRPHQVLPEKLPYCKIDSGYYILGRHIYPHTTPLTNRSCFEDFVCLNPTSFVLFFWSNPTSCFPLLTVSTPTSSRLWTSASWTSGPIPRSSGPFVLPSSVFPRLVPHYARSNV